MDNIYQHFRTEERDIIQTLMSQAARAQDTYAPVLTPFLDPREQFILNVVVKQFEDLMVTFEGLDNSERKRALISPNYYTPTIDDYELQLIEIHYPEKFVTLTHRNVLGTLMSLGIERHLIGDIRVGQTVQFVTTTQMSNYIITHIKKIKGASVKLNELPLTSFMASNESYVVQQATIASLRLDALISIATKKSRTIAQEMIKKEHIKVNHTVITRPNYIVEEGDIFSIMKYGRMRLKSIGERTKKDKIRIEFETLFK